MKANEQLAIQKTNQIISRFQHGGSTKKEIRQIIKRWGIFFSVLFLTTTTVIYFANQPHPDSLFGAKSWLFFISVWLIMSTWFAIGQISQLPEKPLGETIYKMYANYINRHTPGQQITHQFTVTVTENKRK